MVPITTPTDNNKAGKVNLNFIFGLVRSTRFSLVCSDCNIFLCWRRVALKSSADLNLSYVAFSRSFKIAFSTPLGRSFLYVESFSGFSVRCFVAVEMGESPLKGALPVISS